MSRKIAASCLAVLVVCVSIGVCLVNTATSQESTNVTYVIIARDKAQYTITSEDML
jgi:hypothetical protein